MILKITKDDRNAKEGNIQSFFFYLLLFFLFLLGACSNTSNPSKNSMRLTTERLKRFSIQNRDFHLSDSSELMRAVMNVVQDQHYIIREVNNEFGILYADQTYDVGQPFSFFGIPITHFHKKPWTGGNLAIQFGPFDFVGEQNSLYIAKKNSSISVIFIPLTHQQGYQVHVSIEMRDFFNDGHVGEIWLVKDPKIYQKFFESLSKALYLQAQIQ